jgi:hypothetical protein
MVTTNRKQERIDALVAANAVLEAATETSPELDALNRLVLAVTPQKKSTGPRVKLEPADPADVAAYFESTGLTRKQIAAAAGVSTSVISTVQNPKGDRWSTETFAKKQALIDAYIVDHADEIEAARQADAAAAAAKAAKVAAKAAKKAAPKTAKAAPVKKAASTLKSGQSVTVAPRRRVAQAAVAPVAVVASAG